MACPVFGRFNISKAQLDALADAWKRDKPDGLVASIAGSKFQRQDLLRWVTKELGTRGIIVPKGESPKRPCWFMAVDEAYYFGLPRFNYHEAQGRERPSDRSGSLPPVIAAAMAFAAKPSANEVIWDPVMGTGTLIREAAALAPQARIIGSDTDADAIAIAKQALGKAKTIKLITADSTTLDLGRSDLTLTLANLPFGKQFQPEQGTPALYEALLRQSLKAAAPNWRAVLLTSDHAALAQAVKAVGGLTLDKTASVKTRGLAADIWLVTRSR
jgi:predicted RNA methylase